MRLWTSMKRRLGRVLVFARITWTLLATATMWTFKGASLFCRSWRHLLTACSAGRPFFNLQYVSNSHSYLAVHSLKLKYKLFRLRLSASIFFFYVSLLAISLRIYRRRFGFSINNNVRLAACRNRFGHSEKCSLLFLWVNKGIVDCHEVLKSLALMLEENRRLIFYLINMFRQNENIEWTWFFCSKITPTSLYTCPSALRTTSMFAQAYWVSIKE